MNTGLIARAREGDEVAFRRLVDGHRQELEVHCYRILRSSQDAEDVVQETFMAAWRAIAGFEGRASVRTWLYRIATNRCLDALRSAKRRPAPDSVAATGAVSELASPGNVIWLEPYPDVPAEER